MHHHRQLHSLLEQHPRQSILGVLDPRRHHRFQRRRQHLAVVSAVQVGDIKADGLVDELVSGPAVGLGQLPRDVVQQLPVQIQAGESFLAHTMTPILLADRLTRGNRCFQQRFRVSCQHLCQALQILIYAGTPPGVAGRGLLALAGPSLTRPLSCFKISPVNQALFKLPQTARQPRIWGTHPTLRTKPPNRGQISPDTGFTTSSPIR